MTTTLRPFSIFAPPIREQSALRKAITAAYRRPEPECLPPLLEEATFAEPLKADIRKTARQLVQALRKKGQRGGVEELVHEYSLSSQEGVALMCLAEALLRIPDAATRDALIRDKIATGDWKSHLGGQRSLFVNAATWGLVVTGKLTATVNDRSLAAALTQLIGRYGEPVIRQSVDMAMRMMGEQFVTGETISEALKRAAKLEAEGFQYSYDMLGEAATTMKDAERYYRDYEDAIHAIGKASNGRGVYGGPGISIKFSALHPRYTRAQAIRVMTELLPKVKALALIAKDYNIGLNIDAEEADRLELSLDILEDLCLDPDLANWNGIGFVVQAYGKRCPAVLDHLIDLALRSKHRLMIRLVKGAYWDAEIKRAQLDGLDGFPVFTRKIYTDISYIACAKKLLAAREIIFPQFATHNAQTLATIYQLAGRNFNIGDYEFQCLHGMGEPLYEEVVVSSKLNRPCRIYAPVGTHETLLAYLVRRLLENGANSSFVNRISDKSVSVDQLTEDPAEVVAAMERPGAPHEKIRLPRDLFGNVRRNSAGFDLYNEDTLADLTRALVTTAHSNWKALPLLAGGSHAGTARTVLNPANHDDHVGEVVEVSAADAMRAVTLAAGQAQEWAALSVEARGDCLECAAEIMEARASELIGLAMREAGKSAADAIGEVREAVDFLRYYPVEARKAFTPDNEPLGPVVCISPWNFPLAIFTGQIAAALIAGNPVLAKPAEQTPLIAAQAVAILHEAGVPRSALQLVPGDGHVGAALVEAPETSAVMFTGSTEVARLIQNRLAGRLSSSGKPIPLIAETGGQNAMIVDSSALAEQVVGDVIASAFDSAGQRCSALRVLCLQEDVADRTLEMLKGALRELSIGNTDRLSVDIGPVIDAEAKETIEAHIEKMRARGHNVEQQVIPNNCANGTFVPPTIIEIGKLSDLEREVFGPVLHVIRYKRRDIGRLIDEINATGYGLTFGLHTRLDSTIAEVTSRVKVGNIYVNRNIIGAVVGVQPFGGRGLSGTGPKAGGPLYIRRLVTNPSDYSPSAHSCGGAMTGDFAIWLERRNKNTLADLARDIASRSSLGLQIDLDGPVGENNTYALHPRGRVLLAPKTENGLLHQLAATLSTGNTAVIDAEADLKQVLDGLPPTLAARFLWAKDIADDGPYAGALIEGDEDDIREKASEIAALPGPLVLVQAASTEELAQNPKAYCLNWLVEEVSTSINTAAAGGNASLMAIG